MPILRPKIRRDYMRELLALSRALSRALFASGAAALVLLAGACRPDIAQTPTDKVVSAVFDPTTAKIPIPNDLVFPPFNPNLNSVCPPPANAQTGAAACAQAELLAAFQAAGNKFPNDQEVAITIDFTETDLHSNNTTTLLAPELDFTSFKSSTFYVASLTANAVTPVPIDPPKASDYVKSVDHGTLTIHHQGRTPWPPGSYAVVMRGGDDGVKTIDGTPVSPSQIFALIAQGADFTKDENLGLLRAQTGSIEAARAQGAQLAVLVQVYQNSLFKAADAQFPHQELAIGATFSINATTNVTVDAGRGIVPLPIDLLRDPVSGKLSALAACTLAGSRLNPDGTCPSAAAGGFQALDGFSTTGAILAPTSDLIIAGSARGAGVVQLFDLSVPAQPSPVPVADLIIEPCEFTVNPADGTSGCTAPATALAPVIAIQPAGATRGDTSSVFRSKPLKDKTDYAVVITNGVKDKNMKPIGRGTVASILRFTNPVFVNNKSQLLGVDDGTAAVLEKMRLQLKPVFALPSLATTDVAMAYTFRTQTIVDQAVGLAALPYSTPAATALPIATSFQAETPAQAFTKFGVLGTGPTPVPSGNIDEILEVDINTFNALDPITGAFLADPTKASLEPIHVLIATPKADNASIPACAGPLAPLGKCAPLMVFRHGLGGGRADMLLVADSFAAAGMVTVAIDAAKHGDRSFCTPGATGAANHCVAPAVCATLLPSGAQGDVNPPGSCRTPTGPGVFIKRAVSLACVADPTLCPDRTDGIPLDSSNYLISTNFFRTRDTLRQDLIDQSQLIRALAFAPSGPPPTSPTHEVFDHIFGRAFAQTGGGLLIDPRTVYYTGQSFGAIQGMMDVAANPRILKAAFNVGGGTIVDVFSQSDLPRFKAAFQAILDALHITPGTAQFLQFLVVAKTTLDPADPINFAGHLTSHTLPNLLVMPPTLQDPKKILTQIANCDGVVPNAFSFVYASNVPTSPLLGFPGFGGPGTFQLFVPVGAADIGNCTNDASKVDHGFLTDWTKPFAALAQDDIAKFMMNNTSPLGLRHP
ncbi:MAG TPA: hypothetical protein VGD80_23275 [Kofleriaceae bacterium]